MKDRYTTKEQLINELKEMRQRLPQIRNLESQGKSNQVIIKKYPNLVNGVIFTTGDVMNEYTQRFLLELAGRPYLLKPFTIDELINTVRETARQIEKWAEESRKVNKAHFVNWLHILAFCNPFIADVYSCFKSPANTVYNPDKLSNLP